MRVVAQKPKLRCRFCRAFAVFDFRVHAGSALPLAAPAAPCALLSMILGRPAAPRMARVRGQGCELGLRPECRATEQGGVPWRCERSPCCWSRCLRGAGPRRAARVRSQARRRRGAASNAVGAPHAALRGASRPVAGARVSDARVRRKGSCREDATSARWRAPCRERGGAGSETYPPGSPAVGGGEGHGEGAAGGTPPAPTRRRDVRGGRQRRRGRNVMIMVHRRRSGDHAPRRCGLLLSSKSAPNSSSEAVRTAAGAPEAVPALRTQRRRG